MAFWKGTPTMSFHAVLPSSIERLVVDTSEIPHRYLAISVTHQHMQLSPGAYYLLEQVGQGRSFEGLALDLTRYFGRKVAPEEVSQAYERVITKVSQINQKAPTNQSGFWLRLPLLPQKVVN